MANYTASQKRILEAAVQIWIALKKTNTNLMYSSSYAPDLTCSDGTVVKSVRMDCSGVMAAIIKYMGYTLDSESTAGWCSLTSQTLIKGSDGNYSKDWVIHNFDSKDRQPGDILVNTGHTDMYVFTDGNGSYRGFNAGSGNTGDSIGNGMQYSCNLADYYKSSGLFEGGDSTIGAYTISDNDAITVIRYVGSGSGGTYYTDKVIYDIQPLYQPNYLGTDIINNSGGVIINAGYARVDKADPLSGSLDWVSKHAGKVALGFYVYNYMDPGVDYSLLVDRYKGVLQPIKDSGISVDKVQLGFWLDQEYNEGLNDAPWGTKAQNFERYTAFKEAVESLGFSDCVIGIYSGLSAFQTYFNQSDIANTPLWLAWWIDNIETVKSQVAKQGWNKVYIWQYGAENAGHGDIDCNLMIQPIPVLGGGGDVPSTSTTYVLVPAKKIIFDPVPGLIKPGTVVSVSTDAENAKVYVTVNNTFPDPGVPSQNWTGKKFIFNKNYHLRAAAFDKKGEVVAKGSATYTVPWIKPDKEPVDEIILKMKKHRETSMQSYLMYHPEDKIASVEKYIEFEESDE